MPEQALPDFADRVQSAVAASEGLADRLAHQEERAIDVTSTAEYQEIIRLKVIIELETSRTLSETARIAAELDRADLAEMKVEDQ